jgi:hypothetical protein
MKTTATIAVLLALAAAAVPAHATFDFDFKCADGSTMSYSGAHNDMTIEWPGGGVMRLPSAVPDTYMNSFALTPSPGKLCEVGSPLVPCAGMSANEAKQEQVAFHIIRDKRVECEFIPWPEE